MAPATKPKRPGLSCVKFVMYFPLAEKVPPHCQRVCLNGPDPVRGTAPFNCQKRRGAPVGTKARALDQFICGDNWITLSRQLSCVATQGKRLFKCHDCGRCAQSHEHLIQKPQPIAGATLEFFEESCNLRYRLEHVNRKLQTLGFTCRGLPGFFKGRSTRLQTKPTLSPISVMLVVGPQNSETGFYLPRFRASVFFELFV